MYALTQHLMALSSRLQGVPCGCGLDESQCHQFQITIAEIKRDKNNSICAFNLIKHYSETKLKNNFVYLKSDVYS